MTGALTSLVSIKGLWGAVFSVAILFGFMPGACLRCIVLLLPKSDPRRRELIAELYVIPRLEQLTWVAQQLEVCLFEGLQERFRQAVRRSLVIAESMAMAVALEAARKPKKRKKRKKRTLRID